MFMIALLLVLGITAHADCTGAASSKAQVAHGSVGYRGPHGEAYNVPGYGLYGENYSYKPFNFAYQAHDDYGSSHYRQESGQGGIVTGSYGYVDAQGLQRTVNYVADAGGFKAQVQSNEPGIGSESPADVSLLSSKPPAGVQERYTFRGHGLYGTGHGQYGLNGARVPYSRSGLAYGLNTLRGAYGNNGLKSGLNALRGTHGSSSLKPGLNTAHAPYGLNQFYGGPHGLPVGGYNAAAVSNIHGRNKQNILTSSGLINNHLAGQKDTAAIGNLKGIAAYNSAALSGDIYPNTYSGNVRW